MPYVLTYNKKFIERIVSICDFLGLKKDFKCFLIDLELRKDLNIPHALSEVINEDKLI